MPGRSTKHPSAGWVGHLDSAKDQVTAGERHDPTSSSAEAGASIQGQLGASAKLLVTGSFIVPETDLKAPKRRWQPRPQQVIPNGRAKIGAVTGSFVVSETYATPWSGSAKGSIARIAGSAALATPREARVSRQD
jgi:hypothetical protein